jgi:hypothetical protein
VAAAVALGCWLLPIGRDPAPLAFMAPRVRPDWPLPAAGGEQARDEALRRARVWASTDITHSNLSSNPADPAGTISGPLVRCRYLDGPAHGTTAKFDCVLRDGEVVKVKYGRTGEIPAEVAASRLLTALGFGADGMFLVPRVRCDGCIRTPFYTDWLLDKLRARAMLVRSIPADSFSDFEWASVERRFGGAPIEMGQRKGWAWFELDAVDPALGASRAERDALRLTAVLLSHWDNKASNQRLVCLAPVPSEPSPCPAPFALINDVGATFGPNKVDLESWRTVPIWTDRARCMVSMRQFPYGGSTFPDTAISEGGRQLIARELTLFTEPQLVSLFDGARFPGDSHAWAAALMDKIHQIAAGQACPS